MITTEITVSLEWAKRLNEAGWPQRDKEISCHFSWFLDMDDEWYLIPTENNGHFSAPTAEEILRRLPDMLERKTPSGVEKDSWRICPTGHGFNLYYKNGNSHRKTLCSFKDASLANAAAAMWCYLSDHHLLPLV